MTLKSKITIINLQLWTTYLLKFTCNPKINPQVHQQSFADMHLCRVEKTLSCQMCMFSAEVEQGDVQSSCLSSRLVSARVLFVVYLVLCFHIFFAFCWWFCYFKWPPTKVLKCLTVSLSRRRMWGALQRKYVYQKVLGLPW